MTTPYTFEKDVEPKMEAIEKKFDDAQAEIIIYSNKLHKPIFEERDEALKKVEKFWTKALSNCSGAMIYIDDEDRPIFDYLSAIRVERNDKDVREASIHLDFEPNDYFSNSTLTRSFKLKEGAEPLGTEFDFPEHMKSEPFVIDWKSDEKNQAKLRPTKFVEDEEDLEPGSFFSSFFDPKLENLVVTIGDVLINDFYPRAIDYYTGKTSLDDFFMGDEEEDEEDEDEDEDDEEDESDDDREIDLEEEESRPKKKSKN